MRGPVREQGRVRPKDPLLEVPPWAPTSARGAVVERRRPALGAGVQRWARAEAGAHVSAPVQAEAMALAKGQELQAVQVSVWGERERRASAPVLQA